MQTTSLNDGTLVLAKKNGDAVSFANRTQAERRAAAEGPGYRVREPRGSGRAWYIAVVVN